MPSWRRNWRELWQQRRHDRSRFHGPELLREAGFGNLTQVELEGDEAVFFDGDLADPAARQRILRERFTFFGPTAAGYRLQAYRSLPVGRTPAPPDLPTDIHMWRKFLSQEHLRFATRVAITSVRFAQRTRNDWTMEQRANEVASWVPRLAQAAERASITHSALLNVSRSAYDAKVKVGILWAQVEEYRAQEAEFSAKVAEFNAKAAELDARRAEFNARQLETSANLARTQAELREVRNRLRSTRKTLSWRLTRPFRKLARLVLGRDGA